MSNPLGALLTQLAQIQPAAIAPELPPPPVEEIVDTALVEAAPTPAAIAERVPDASENGGKDPEAWRLDAELVAAVEAAKARIRDDLAYATLGEDETGRTVDPTPIIEQIGTRVSATVKIPKPLAPQKPVLEHPARFKMNRAGRRFGKTRLAFIAGTRGHGPRIDRHGVKGFRWKGIMEGGDVVWLVPDFPQGMAIWQEEIVPRFGGVPGIRMREKDFSITLPNGGRLRLWTVKNIRSLRGKKFDGAIIDEAAFIPLRYVWRSIVRPTLIDRSGWAIMISSTLLGSDFNAMIREVEDDMMQAERSIEQRAIAEVLSLSPSHPAYHRKRKRWHAWHFRTADNPRISREELQELAEDYPPGSAEAAQELDAELLETLGTLFKTEWWKTYGAGSRHAITGGDLEHQRFPFAQLAMLVDLAASESEMADYTAATVAGITLPDPQGTRRVGILDVMNERYEGPDAMDALFALAVRWGVSVVYVESVGYQLTAVQTLKRRLAAKRIQVRAWNPKGKGDKRARSIPWAAMVSRGEVFLPLVAPWKESWLAQHAKFPNGKEKSPRVEDHDDMVDTGSMLADVLTVRGVRRSRMFKVQTR